MSRAATTATTPEVTLPTTTASRPITGQPLRDDDDDDDDPVLSTTEVIIIVVAALAVCVLVAVIVLAVLVRRNRKSTADDRNYSVHDVTRWLQQRHYSGGGGHSVDVT